MELIIRNKASAESILARSASLVYKGLEAGPVVFTIGRLSKSREQEEKYHALIGDIAKTVDIGVNHDFEAWKALLVHEYEQELKRMGERLRHPGRIILSLDKSQAITVRASTKDFLKKEASGFIQFLYAWGVEHGAKFSEKAIGYYDQEV